MGKAVKGVVMKTSHLGAIEMIAEGASQVVKRMRLSDQDNSTQEQLGETYERAAKRMRVSATDSTGTPGAVTMKSRARSSKERAEDDEEDDDALLDDLWGRSMVMTSRDPKGDGLLGT